MEAAPFIEVNRAITEAGGEDLNLCYQCGKCTSTCPWGLVREFNVRKIIRLAQAGLEGFESGDLWLCTTCGACVQGCPREVGIIDLMRAMRNIIMESGSSPPPLRTVIGSINSQGNPLSEKRELRTDWAKGLTEVKIIDKVTDYLLFICCFSAYDPRSQKVTVALSRILHEAGVNFGIIGIEESCCGESIRKIGGESLFADLVEKNSRFFWKFGVEKVITTSPHCYQTFKNDYPFLGKKFKTLHYTQLIAELIEDKRLSFSKLTEHKVTYHDPCYLGRHNGVFDPPRRVLKAIPGIELVEMERSKENGLCCGGGGGGLWMEVPKGERFSEWRIEEAIGTGAEILVTACPYCFAMLEDARLSLNKEDVIKVMELPELIIKAL